MREQLIFCDSISGFLRNYFWGTTAEIPYWWRTSFQIWVVLLIGWSKFSFFFFPCCQVGYLREVILKVLNLVLLFQSYWDNGIQNIRWGKTLSKYIFKTFPFPRCPKPLFQTEAKCEAIDLKIMFLNLVPIKLLFTRKALGHSVSVWNL